MIECLGVELSEHEREWSLAVIVFSIGDQHNVKTARVSAANDNSSRV